MITGKVIDEEGDPVSGVTVQAVRQQWVIGGMTDIPQSTTQTNDLGEFRLSGVRPGKCYLFALKRSFEAPDNSLIVDSGKPERRLVRTFYPEAISRDAAAPLDLQAGQDLSGIDIRMHSALTYHVGGKLIGVLSEGEGERVTVAIQARGERLGIFPPNQSTVGKAHTFDLPGVVPGSYELFVQNMGGGSSHLTGRQQIEVGAADLNDVALSVLAPASLKGRVQLQGTPSATGAAANLNSAHIRLTTAESVRMFGSFANATPGADGAFTLENVSAGKYSLMVNAPYGTYLQSVRFGAQEVRGRYLDLSGGAAGELDIVFHYGTAEVDVNVQDTRNPAASEAAAGAKPAVSANVLLVPEELNEDGSGLQFNSTDASGAFSLKQVPPGRYKAYAFENTSFADLQNPEVLKELASKGTDVEVKENDTKQIQLPLISAGEFQQILTKLGLDSAQ